MLTTLIDDLGGNRGLADALRTTPGAVANWRMRGRIPYRYRPAIARIAADRAIQLPENFWEGVAA